MGKDKAPPATPSSPPWGRRAGVLRMSIARQSVVGGESIRPGGEDGKEGVVRVSAGAKWLGGHARRALHVPKRVSDSPLSCPRGWVGVGDSMVAPPPRVPPSSSPTSPGLA